MTFWVVRRWLYGEVGYLTSAYPLGMFGALFLWPRLSDRVGRKPILVLSLLGVGCGLVAQAVGPATCFIISRDVI